MPRRPLGEPSASVRAPLDPPGNALAQRRRALAGRGIRPGLDTIRSTLETLGSPHLRQQTVLVGGTNGKGSTANLVASMATAAGYRVGLFTSPHLERFEEQIRVDGENIATGELLRLWDRVVAAAEAVGPGAITGFEVLTACALLRFAERGVDLAVCEVGMGGRLDSTNVVEPTVSAVTSLGLDHGAFLGSGLQDIAAHKAGIFRPGRPALIGFSEPVDGEHLLAAEAQRMGAVAQRVRDTVRFDDVHPLADGSQRMTLQTPAGSYDLHLALAGHHQRLNVALAVAIAESLRRQGRQQLDERAIRRGVARCRWPGRLETLRVGSCTVLLDAAHNASGAVALARHLQTLDVPFELLFGAMADKDVDGMLERLSDAQRFWLSAPLSDRAWDPNRFLTSARPSMAPVEGPLPLAEALRRALHEAEDRWLVVTGSLRLVGDARSLLFKHYDPQPWTGRLQ